MGFNVQKNTTPPIVVSPPLEVGLAKPDRKKMLMGATALITCAVGVAFYAYSSQKSVEKIVKIESKHEPDRSYSWIMDEVSKFFETTPEQVRDIQSMGQGLSSSFRLHSAYRTVSGAIQFFSTPIGFSFAVISTTSLTINLSRFCGRISKVFCCCC